MVVHDAPNHVVCGLFSVVVTDHLSAFVEGGFEKGRSQIPLASLADTVRRLAPHVGDEDVSP